ncbi:MAG: transcriptional repressor NrdR [Verrucomicrobia bacterium]|jgi:transcriptional repressor NrdR|nr:transcriptional repressor NrdR [Verrucomicrobiota bacterium]
MRCPKCSHMEDKVLDSRVARNGDATRRRRICMGCGYRFTTYEEVVRPKLRVIKTDGRHEEFDRNKLMTGIERACEKRPVSAGDIESLVDTLIEEIESEYEREVASEIVGQKVMDRLEKLDDVAFVRFASVYRRFRDVNQFVNAIKDMIGKS